VIDMAEIRIHIPDTLAGLRYCLRHPKAFLIGRYGYRKFIKQRDIMFAAIRRADEAEQKLKVISAKLKDTSIELSKLKRQSSK
jgi:hypothetical protein